MALPLVLAALSVFSVLVSYVVLRLYRSRASLLPTSVVKTTTVTTWDWRKIWSRPSTKKKPKHISVDLLPTTGLPPPPTALVDLSPLPIPRTPSPNTLSLVNKQIHNLYPTSFPRPPSPHALLATTSPQKQPRRSRSLGGVPVRRLSGGASGLRNVRILDPDMEMQELNKGTSREHLLIDFSSSDSSDELDAFRREEDISPASSDIGVLPPSHRRCPSLFDDPNTLNLAPGRKVVPLVDLDNAEDALGLGRKDDDAWKWFTPPPLLGKSPLISTPTPISKSVSEPLPIIPLPLPTSEGKLIDFHSGTEQEHVLVDLDVQHDNNVSQPEFIHVRGTNVDPDVAVVNFKHTAGMKTAVDVKPQSSLEGRRSLDSLMKPTIVPTPGPIPIEIRHALSSSVVEEKSSQRGRRVDRHPLEEVHGEETKEVLVEVEEDLPVTTEVGKEDQDQDRQELVNEDEYHEFYDHHDDYNYVYDIRPHHHSPSPLDTIKGEERSSFSSTPAVATVPPLPPVQAAPAWYWDSEDDPWNGAVGVVDEVGVAIAERDVIEQELVEEREEADVVEERGEVDLMVAGLEVEDDAKTSPGCETVELSLEEVMVKMEDEESYPDPDYLPLPDLLLDTSPVAPEVPLVLVDGGLPDEDVGEVQNDQDGELLQQQQVKDEEKSSKREAAQMPTPPASPPPSPLRVRSLGLGGGARSGPPSPNSLSSLLLPSVSPPSPLPLSTSRSGSPKLTPLVVLTPPNISSSPPSAVEKATEGGDKENNAVGVVDMNASSGRPLWSIRADDAPALGLAASSLSISTTCAGLIPGGTSPNGVSPRMRRRVLGDVENGEREKVVEFKEVEEKEEKEEVVKGRNEEDVKEEDVVDVVVKGEVKEDILKEDDDDDDGSSLPGSFPQPTDSSDTNTILAPTITIAALTSTLLSTSIAAASSSITSTTTSITSETTSSPITQRRPRQPISRSPLDIALAMQLRPGLGVGADPAWMVRFLMAMFGWFAILVSGQGEF